MAPRDGPAKAAAAAAAAAAAPDVVRMSGEGEPAARGVALPTPPGVAEPPALEECGCGGFGGSCEAAGGGRLGPSRDTGAEGSGEGVGVREVAFELRPVPVPGGVQRALLGTEVLLVWPAAGSGAVLIWRVGEKEGSRSSDKVRASNGLWGSLHS